jgi:hypothetical protein
MSCDRYRDALRDLAAGGSAHVGLEAHLASCDGCSEELAGFRRALGAVEAETARLVRAEPSAGLAARIRSAVEAQQSAPAWRFGWMWPAVAASVVLLVALAVWATRAPGPPRVAVGNEPAATPAESRPARPASPTAEGPGPSRTSEPPHDLATSPRHRPTGAPREASEAGRVRHASGPAGSVPAPPEVLVPRGEAEALVRFAAIVHRDRQAPAAFAAVGEPSPDLAEPAALKIAPLEIVPLDPAESSGTD